MEPLFTTILLLVIMLSITIIIAIVCTILKLIGFPFKKNFKRGLWILIAVPLTFLYGIFIERNQTQIRTVEIESEKIPKSFNDYKIVQISDIHMRSFIGREKTLAKMIENINKQNPDIILFTGDLVTINTAELQGRENILKRLKAKDGILSILGNHDYSFYNKWKNEKERINDANQLIKTQKAIGWDVLLNENRNITRKTNEITDTISIIGVENISTMHKFRSFGDLNKAMHNANGKYKILMTHDPSHWRAEVTNKTDIDLTLSGHTHGMQFTIFGWSIISFIYKEYNGLYKEKEQYLYVNIGLGETMFPFRIGAIPEITVITLNSTQS